MQDKELAREIEELIEIQDMEEETEPQIQVVDLIPSTQ